MSTCDHCGALLETEKEKKRNICEKCLTKGFWKFSEVIGKIRKEHGDLDVE